MNTNESNKRTHQEKTANVAPNTGSDQKQPIQEPAQKTEEERKAKSAS